MCLTCALQVVSKEEQNVLGTLAQRGHKDLDDVQSIVKVLSEQPALDLLPKIAVRRRDQPDVRAAGNSIRTDWLNLARLGESQENRLHPQAHLSQFVEEKGSVVSLTHKTRLVAIRTCETASYVSEQL